MLERYTNLSDQSISIEILFTNYFRFSFVSLLVSFEPHKSYFPKQYQDLIKYQNKLLNGIVIYNTYI